MFKKKCCFFLRVREFYFYIFKFLFIFLFLAALGLCCCPRAFSSCGAGAPLCCGARASHCSGFSCCRAQALGMQASVVAARGLQSAGSVVVAHGLSCSTACGIFPDQGSNLCPLCSVWMEGQQAPAQTGCEEAL